MNQNRLTIIISGKLKSGMSTLAKMIATEYLNAAIGKPRFELNKFGKETIVLDTFNNQPVIFDYPNDQLKQISSTYSVKIYSFLDPLKKICIDMFGLDPMQCYGCESDKDSYTHISWDDIYNDIKKKYSKKTKKKTDKRAMNDFLTAEQFLTILKDDFALKFDPNSIARSLYSLIHNDNYKLSIIEDAKSPNEITIGTETGAKVIRLLRHQSEQTKEDKILDDFPLGEYNLVVDNKNMTMQETHNHIKPKLHDWFKTYKII